MIRDCPYCGEDVEFEPETDSEFECHHCNSPVYVVFDCYTYMGYDMQDIFLERVE